MSTGHAFASTSSPHSSAAARLLQRQLKEMRTSQDLTGISVGLVRESNVFEWEVILMINDDCKYYGGAYFRAIMYFPPEYPHLPPRIVFQNPVPFHPNIYPSGDLCISILHAPGDDMYGYESAAERWSPVQTPETILLSVLSLFNEPNDESAANLDAAKLLRAEKEGGPKEFRKRVRQCVRESLGEN
ncbi:ubiquitin-conjugating enzyme E2 [Hypoxylon trugodes]|uniref:ubiquitin-conjugating enzyme E2 n=1 Tax=Hypoxylon trugodes TaxID=326681 RepID=UPI00218F11B0|nr:ubiquitin-conjugating enzyme E2 [Hypoxylon trugodes]KAI1382686.1 ubiquitin-conjugating enzyme E2 [Hypoxylon trugodes]